MDEFAMGSSTENSAFGPTRNPWDAERVPGGSSGGSAAAVAALEVPYALGSDTGGSIRQPAALCGVVGMKPTYGRVSRYGLVAFASSLDQIGPFTRDVRDCATVLNAICGHDPCDSTSAAVDSPDFTADLRKGVRGLRIGVPREYMPSTLDAGVRARIEDALRALEAQGAIVDFDMALPSTEAALAVYYIIAPSEASANLARYDGVKYGFSYRQGGSMWENMEKTRGLGFGAEVKRRIMIGTYALSSGYYDAYYLKAQKVRTVIRREFDAAFERYDVIASPVTPTTAFKIGEKTADPYAMYLNDVFTLPVNIAGKPFDEATVLRAAYAYEQGTDWRSQRPPL
jgi:aspartyl-tRNA(Asn)/glutamyl-tRNA(Gln) amidotransferase subunit A